MVRYPEVGIHLPGGDELPFAAEAAARPPGGLVDGIFNLIASFRSASHHWALLIESVIGILVSILTFAWPPITAIVLLYLISFWAIFTGLIEIIAGVRLRKAITNEWALLKMGALSMLFGILICPRPLPVRWP